MKKRTESFCKKCDLCLFPFTIGFFHWAIYVVVRLLFVSVYHGFRLFCFTSSPVYDSFLFSINVDTRFALSRKKVTLLWIYCWLMSFRSCFTDIWRFTSWLFRFLIQNYAYRKVFKVFSLVYRLKFFVVNQEIFMNLQLIISKNYWKDEVSWIWRRNIYSTWSESKAFILKNIWLIRSNNLVSQIFFLWRVSKEEIGNNVYDFVRWSLREPFI